MCGNAARGFGCTGWSEREAAMFANDRDLLVFEPELFRDVGWVGQRLTLGQAGVSGTTLTATGLTAGFDVLGVGVGSVALVDGVPLEVVERLSSTTLTVSRVRGSVSDAAIPPSSVTAGALEVFTFGPQIRTVHRQTLRMVGLEPLGEASADELDASAVTNPEDLRRVEALGALHLIFAAASAPGSSADGPGSSWAARARMYRERYSAERGRVAALVDVDGDGRAEAARRLNVVRFVRG